MRVLITRSIENAARTCAAVQEQGHATLATALFSVVPVAHTVDGKYDAVLASSAHAPRLFSGEMRQRLSALPFFAVGDATAEAARNAGFHAVHSANGDGEALVRLIGHHTPGDAKLVYLAGVPRRDHSIQKLSPTYRLDTIEVYRTDPVDTLHETVISALRNRSLDAVMHFSPRSATVFLDLAEAANLPRETTDILHICISHAALDPRMVRTRVASQPTQKCMVEALNFAEPRQ